ncbi:MAG: ThuA domain-containing protein [Myxococcota bacterium]|nr:ThuA domain-containing protein [Myxococcota bacterium]
MTEPIRAYLVANARYHDTDYARLELLGLLSEHPEIRTHVAHDFSDVSAIAEADFLISYTCDLRPTEDQEIALRDFVASGKRWIALHGTNAILAMGPEGMYCPRIHDTFMETLGSRFISHPPSMPYTVTVSDPDHPLVSGMDSFETEDELYLCEYYGEIKPLLETRFTGTFQSGYVENEWPDDEPRLIAYTHPVGDGEVLYITLGHCCGAYDMRPIQPVAEVVRGSWENPTYIELLRRAIRWGQKSL